MGYKEVFLGKDVEGTNQACIHTENLHVIGTVQYNRAALKGYRFCRAMYLARTSRRKACQDTWALDS